MSNLIGAHWKMDAAADLKQRPSKAASFIHIHTRVTDYSSVPVMAHGGVKMDFRQSRNVNLLSYCKCLFILMTFSSLYVQIVHAATIVYIIYTVCHSKDYMYPFSFGFTDSFSTQEHSEGFKLNIRYTNKWHVCAFKDQETKFFPDGYFLSSVFYIIDWD